MSHLTPPRCRKAPLREGLGRPPFNIMNKKAYIKPEIEVIGIESVEMLAGSLVFNDKYVDTEQQLSHGYRPGRRGKWGDLWYQGEEE